MADVSFLFKKKTTLGKSTASASGTILGGIVFDASLTESYRTQADVTNHPVEDGTLISDHIQVKPIEIEIVGIISNTPLPFAHPDPAVLRSFITPRRAEDAYDKLVDLQKSGELVTIATTLDTFENMAIVSLQLDRDAPTANVIKVRIALREIKRAQNLAADLRKTAAKNAEKAKLGGKAAAKSAAGAANVAPLVAGLKKLAG